MIEVLTPFPCSFAILLVAQLHPEAKILSFPWGTSCFRSRAANKLYQNSHAKTHPTGRVAPSVFLGHEEHIALVMLDLSWLADSSFSTCSLQPAIKTFTFGLGPRLLEPTPLLRQFWAVEEELIYRFRCEGSPGLMLPTILIVIGCEGEMLSHPIARETQSSHRSTPLLGCPIPIYDDQELAPLFWS